MIWFVYFSLVTNNIFKIPNTFSQEGETRPDVLLHYFKIQSCILFFELILFCETWCYVWTWYSFLKLITIFSSWYFLEDVSGILFKCCIWINFIWKNVNIILFSYILVIFKKSFWQNIESQLSHMDYCRLGRRMYCIYCNCSMHSTQHQASVQRCFLIFASKRTLSTKTYTRWGRDVTLHAS